METRNPNILYCEKCDTREYETVDKHIDANGETQYASVCFPCKNAILTERNIGNCTEYDDEQEGEENRMADYKPIDALSHSEAEEAADAANAYAVAVENAEYIEHMADRFGVGGRY